MQKIFRITRLELSVLFFSPIAWLLLIIFVVQCGITYTGILYAQETSQQLARPLNVLTRVLFSGDDGLLTKVSENLYLFIPLLTMGLMSREISSGSIKLLQSSPVTNLQVVLGKFGAMMVYGGLLCGILVLYLLAAWLSVESLDVGFVLGGIFALFLLLCAYSAIGLFMSCLTGYQIVAAISTLAVLAAFNYVGQLWQGVDGLRDITYWLSLSGKVDGMINGLVTSRDILYFLSFTAFFLTLAVMKLNAGRRRRPLAIRIASYTAIVLGLVAIIYFSSRPRYMAYFDTTRSKDQTLSKKSQELIAQLDKPVKLTTYTNLLDYKVGFGEPKNRINDKRRFERFQRFLPDMEMEYVNYYDSVKQGLDTSKTLEEQARHVAKVRGFNFDKVLSPSQIRQHIDLTAEGNGFVRLLEYDGKRTPLRMYDDLFQYPGESEVMAAFKRLKGGTAKVWLLAANHERSMDKLDNGAYQIVTNGLPVRASLINQGFDTLPVDLDSVDEIPLDITVLIIADPMEAYSPEMLAKIEAYINKGGNLLLAGEPGKQALVNPIAEKVGIRLDEGTILQESAYNELDLAEGLLTPQADSLGFGFFDGAKVSMPNAAPLIVLDTARFTLTPLLVSHPMTTWNKLGTFDLANEKVVFDPSTETKGQHLLLAALQRKVGQREQRIIVSGDADFMSNREITQRFGVQNANFVIAKMFRWFTYGEFPYSPNSERAIDRVIKVDRAQINQQKWLFFAVVPLLLGTLGAVTLALRKRK